MCGTHPVVVTQLCSSRHLSRTVGPNSPEGQIDALPIVLQLGLMAETTLVKIHKEIVKVAAVAFAYHTYTHRSCTPYSCHHIAAALHAVAVSMIAVARTVALHVAADGLAAVAAATAITAAARATPTHTTAARRSCHQLV
jgi:hypothetical protein